jgi:hypothetical protein
MDKTPKQLQEELQAKQIKAHQEWLKHPITNDAINLLKIRGDKYYGDLVSSVLKETNEPLQITNRACISTITAVLKILTDSQLFVEQQNNNKQ